MNDSKRQSGGEPEWDFLEGLWHRAPVSAHVPEEVRARVRRQEWRMRIGAAAEWLLAGLLVALVVWQFTVDDSTTTAIWGFLVLWTTGWLLSFSIRNRRGLWLPAAETARDYLELARRRLASQHRALRVAWLAYAAQLAVLAIWETAARLDIAPPMFGAQWPIGVAGLALFTAALVIWTRFQSRRLARETRAFDAFEKEFASTL